jgi:peptidoglycan/LPS O-acetylase OafA/YrhL
MRDMNPSAGTQDNKTTTHFLAMDGLRGIAAIAVAGMHVLDHLQTSFELVHAYLAVDFFFMLSGFVIAHAYDRSLASNFGVRQFMLIRFIRLYPLIALGIVVGAISLICGGITPSGVIKAAAMNGLMLPTTVLLNIRPLAFPVNSPMWSLAFEVWINLAYASVFRYFTNTRVLITVVLSAFATFGSCLVLHGLNVGFDFNDYYLGIIRVVFPFFTGILLGRLLSRRQFRTGWAHLTIAALMVILLWPGLDFPLYDAFIVLVFFPSIIAASAFAAPNHFLDPIWRYLGNISYPLYALHYPFVVVFSVIMHHLHVSAAVNYVAAVLMTLACIGLAHAALQFYDLPVRRYLSRWQKKCTTISPEPSEKIVSALINAAYESKNSGNA